MRNKRGQGLYVCILTRQDTFTLHSFLSGLYGYIYLRVYSEYYFIIQLKLRDTNM